jgi:ubiquinol-cytochrome c reductase iron-sulfur subunit
VSTDDRDQDRERLAAKGRELDGVRVVSEEPARRSADPAGERRSRRRVALLLVASMLFGALFIGVFVAWPGDYVPPSDPGWTLFALHTPVLGVSFALSVGALGAAVITYVKSFYPDEVSVQQLEPGGSEPEQRETAVAVLREVGSSTGFGRRSLLRRLGIAGFGVFGLMAGVVAVGGFVKNPWRGGRDAPLWTTGWAPTGETVYLREATGDPTDIQRLRPEDLEQSAMVTVVPFRESERGDTEKLLEVEHAADNPVMLIRLPPGTPVTHRPGQEDLHWGDFYAFSKVCTHLGCPPSLYDTQLTIALCPCHQSKFLVTESARPVFGPAVRPLPQLPIDVDADGYFVARGDFPEPVGPSFWEIGAGTRS